MDKKLRVDVLETSDDKEDISHLANRMFDQNVDSFTQGEAMNRDYLHQIYGESMDFLNKEVRLTRTKYYEMCEKIEKRFAESIKYEKNKMVVVTAVFLVLIIFAVISFCISDNSFDKYYKLYNLSFYEYLDKNIIRGYWAMGGLLFGVGWIALVTGITVFGMLVYNSIKNIKQYKKKQENALKRLEQTKQECMMMGTYDALK